MPISERDRELIQTLQTARDQHPELAGLLDFYQELFEVQMAARAQLPRFEAPQQSILQSRLDKGRPLLNFDELPLEGDTYSLLVGEIRDLLLHHNPRWRPGLRPAPAELQLYARQAFENWGTFPASDDDAASDDPLRQDPALLQAASLALVPFVQRAAESLLPGLDLEAWNRGDCPVCGGRPNLARLGEERGQRMLVCSHCDTLWPYPRVGCPFCGSQESQTYYVGEGGLYRLYICPACRRHLKTVDLRQARRGVNPVVERLLSIGMDLAAESRQA